MTDTSILDRSAAVAVLDVMRRAGSVSEEATVSELRALPGGFSRRMYRADVVDPLGEDLRIIVCSRGPESLLDRSLEQECDLYRALRDVAVPTPRVHGICTEAENPLGGDFFVMDRLPGVAPNVWRSSDRQYLEENWQSSRSVAADMASILAAIHRTDVTPLRGFVRSLSFVELVGLWRSSYENVRLAHDPVVDEAYEWVLKRAPEPVQDHLVHGDYRVGNCLIHEGSVRAVLDWELAYLGDPRFDLGYLNLAYFSGKLFAPGSSLMGAFAERQWFWDQYSAQTGVPIDPEVVLTFSVVGALMLIANLSSGVHTFVKRGANDLRMLWSRLPIMSLRQDLVHLMRWPSAVG